jgi:hypothetical protein
MLWLCPANAEPAQQIPKRASSEGIHISHRNAEALAFAAASFVLTAANYCALYFDACERGNRRMHPAVSLVASRRASRGNPTANEYIYLYPAMPASAKQALVFCTSL